MKSLIALILSFYASSAFSLCEDSKFANKSASSTNGHTAKILAREDKVGYLSYLVQFDGGFEQTLTHIEKESCGWGVVEPSSILGFKTVSPVHSIYEFSWYYLPGGSAYAGKYFCYMYVQLDDDPEALFNSCSRLIDEPGLPDGFTRFEFRDNKLIITDEDNEVVFEKKL